ncbi:MAG: TlpA family protein disulfide reductase [Bacteroidales bacterium]|nr:TlpA family protein disulfide reductase [Bacteroidales bacterium]
MKISKLITAATAALTLASCAKVSDTTTITGTVVPEGLDNVNIVIKEQLDTLVPVTDGKFKIEIPANVCVMATASAGECAVSFIPDGTKLNIVLDNESKVESSSPKISVQARYNDFNTKLEAMFEEFSAKRQEIRSSDMSDEDKEEAFNDFYDTFMEGYKNYNIEVFDANTDNIIGIVALDNFRYEISDEEIAQRIDALTPALQEHSYIASMKEAVQARIATAEGKMFTDFTVETVVGMTRSIPAQPKYSTVKFSDYVGKGKYVLVDFWSPWCGPCKREMPNIRAIYDKYHGKNFDVLSIAVWERQGPEVTIDTAAELGMIWNQINNAGSVPTEIYGIEGIPHIMLIGPDGTILKRGLYGEALAEAVAEYLD